MQIKSLCVCCSIPVELLGLVSIARVLARWNSDVTCDLGKPWQLVKVLGKSFVRDCQQMACKDLLEEAKRLTDMVLPGLCSATDATFIEAVLEAFDAEGQAGFKVFMFAWASSFDKRCSQQRSCSKLYVLSKVIRVCCRFWLP